MSDSVNEGERGRGCMMTRKRERGFMKPCPSFTAFGLLFLLFAYGNIFPIDFYFLSFTIEKTLYTFLKAKHLKSTNYE
jgi:hypothetical protein